ncbi:MAG: 3-deoxy-7-phosphoheptulonate synthase [Alkalispirochaetaceae bacterium]
MERASNLNIHSFVELPPPKQLKAEYPASEKSNATVVESRQTIRRILAGEDRRFLAVVGPCSIHDSVAAEEYASRLVKLREKLVERIYIVMRVYFEKPRTRLGWRGLILDPNLDGSYEIEEGLIRARKTLSTITGLGLAAGSEMLDPIIPQYIDEFVSWSSIGARTTESQTHREMASGLSMPVGFKNGLDGSVESALNAMASSLEPHSFLGIDEDGATCVVHTRGNPHVHLIMRGGNSGPNYYPWDIVRAEELLKHNNLPSSILVDCSHGNSQKNHSRQREALSSVLDQRSGGRESITGFMLESNLLPGRQNPAPLEQLEYGKSITDSCIGWEETEELLENAFDRAGTWM